nr:MAG TPA: hypothetical protein [Caudoviricetes sp.]
MHRCRTYCRDRSGQPRRTAQIQALFCLAGGYTKRF